MTPTKLAINFIHVRPAANDPAQPILMDCKLGTFHTTTSFEISNDELELLRTARRAAPALGATAKLLPATGQGVFGRGTGGVMFDPAVPYDAKQLAMSAFVVSSDPVLLKAMGLSRNQIKEVLNSIADGVVQRLLWDPATGTWIVGNGCTTYTLNPQEPA